MIRLSREPAHGDCSDGAGRRRTRENEVNLQLAGKRALVIGPAGTGAGIGGCWPPKVRS